MIRRPRIREGATEITRIVATVIVAASIAFGASSYFAWTQVRDSQRVGRVETCQARVDDRLAAIRAIGKIARAGSPYAAAGRSVLMVHPCPELAAKVVRDRGMTVP